MEITDKTIRQLNQKQLYRLLSIYTLKQLKVFAKEHDIPIGANKECILFNLIAYRKKFDEYSLHLTIEDYI